MEALRVKKPKRKAKKGIEPEWMKKYPQITRAQAIQVFCRECMGYTKHRGGGSESQAWKMAGQMAKECSDTKCPLHRFRPGARRELKLVSNTLQEPIKTQRRAF